jgi:integrase
LATFGNMETHSFCCQGVAKEGGMIKKALTDRKVQSLKPDATIADTLGHHDTWDAVVPGLGVRTSRTGRRTFVLMARFPGSKNPTRRALGVYGELTLEQARAKARTWLELIRKGVDPAVAEAEQRRAAIRLQQNTFASVAEDYLRLHVIGLDPDRPRQRRALAVARDFRIFITIWGERPIASISRHDVLTLIESVRDRGTIATLESGKGAPAPEQARSLLGYLKTFFDWCIERGTYGLEVSPCDHLRASRIIGDKHSSERTLTDAEIRAFWDAAGEMSYPFNSIYRLLLLTGLRLNEVADAAWPEFDLPQRLWTIPAHRMKGKNGKARPHNVPLTADMLAILDSLPRFNGGPYLFSATNGQSPSWVSSEIKARVDAAMAKRLRADVPAWTNHDLRRTVRSRLSELRVSPDVAEAILAHVKPGIRGVYDRYELLDEKRDALESWAQRLRKIVAC